MIDWREIGREMGLLNYAGDHSSVAAMAINLLSSLTPDGLMQGHNGHQVALMWANHQIAAETCKAAYFLELDGQRDERLLSFSMQILAAFDHRRVGNSFGWDSQWPHEAGQQGTPPYNRQSSVGRAYLWCSKALESYGQEFKPQREIAKSQFYGVMDATLIYRERLMWPYRDTDDKWDDVGHAAATVEFYADVWNYGGWAYSFLPGALVNTTQFMLNGDTYPTKWRLDGELFDSDTWSRNQRHKWAFWRWRSVLGLDPDLDTRLTGFLNHYHDY